MRRFLSLIDRAPAPPMRARWPPSTTEGSGQTQRRTAASNEEDLAFCWVIEGDFRELAAELAISGSKACNRKVEVGAFLQERVLAPKHLSEERCLPCPTGQRRCAVRLVCEALPQFAPWLLGWTRQDFSACTSSSVHQFQRTTPAKIWFTSLEMHHALPFPEGHGDFDGGGERI